MSKTGNRTYKGGGQLNNTNRAVHSAYRQEKKLMRDRRTRLAKYVVQVQTELTQALGGPETVSPQEQLIIPRAAFKAVRCALAEAAMISQKGKTPKTLKFDYLRWSKELREDLKLLGMKRLPRDVQVPTLQSIAARAAQQQSSTTAEVIPVNGEDKSNG